MCGRFTLTTPMSQIENYFGISITATNIPILRPRYNIAPSQDILVIKSEDGEHGSSNKSFAVMRWGLIPHWLKEEKIGSQWINARAETVDSKPLSHFVNSPYHDSAETIDPLPESN